MKKFLTKFISIFFAFIFLSNCSIVLASASTTETISEDELLTHFSSVPLSVKSKFYDDDGIIFNHFLILREKNYYFVYCFATDEEDIASLDYILLSSSSCYFRDSDNQALSFKYSYVSFDFDGIYSLNALYGLSAFIRTGYNYVNSTGDSIQSFVDNILYSSVNIKYNDYTVYDKSNNVKVVIDDFLTLNADDSSEIIGPQPLPSEPGDYDFVGPLPLIPIDGDPTYQGFKDWLIKNKKYEELSQFGISCTASNISAVVDLWTGNYNSVFGFFSSLKSTWSTISLISQAKNIYNWFEHQWQLYKKSLITYETIEIKDEILDYDTDYDENGNFISSETSYLKLILGTLMSFKVSFSSYVDTLVSYISSLDVNLNRLLGIVTVAPKCTADAIYNNLVNPFNLILDAISSGNGGTTENVTNNYYYTAKDVTDDDATDFSNLFDEYNIKFSSLIDSKYHFLNQITSIFDEIFQACSYTEASETSLQTFDTKLQNSTYPQHTQKDYIDSKMSTVFGNYDPNYLDDASTAKAPHYTIDIAGTDVDIIDFRPFAKYRTLIYAVITLTLWVPYLWSLYKSIPSIIAGVSDLHNMLIPSVGIESPSEFESNILLEEEQRNANKVEDFDAIVKNKDGTYSAYN